MLVTLLRSNHIEIPPVIKRLIDVPLFRVMLCDHFAEDRVKAAFRAQVRMVFLYYQPFPIQSMKKLCTKSSDHSYPQAVNAISWSPLRPRGCTAGGGSAHFGGTCRIP